MAPGAARRALRRSAHVSGAPCPPLSRVNRQRGRRARIAQKPAHAVVSACLFRPGAVFPLTAALAAPSAPPRNAPAPRICLRSPPNRVHHHAGSVPAAARAQQSLRASSRLGVRRSLRSPSFALPVQTISLPVRRALAADDIGCARPVQRQFAPVPGYCRGPVTDTVRMRTRAPSSLTAGLDVRRFLLVLSRCGGRGPSVARCFPVPPSRILCAVL